MTLNIRYMLRSALRMILTKLQVDKPTHSWLITFYRWYVTSRCDIDFDPLILNVCTVSAVMKSHSVANVCGIEQSTAELLRFKYVQFGPCPPS